MRALAADPDTDFAALPADEFFAVLKYACQDDAVSPALMAEAGRRIAAGESGPRELHQVPCHECGTTALVPFLPRLDRPVYCSTCYDRVRPAVQV